MKNKLNSHDFITIGIFNAIGIVVYMAVAFTLTLTIVGGFISSGVALGIAAPIYLLMGVKIHKKGVFVVSGILLGIIALAGGHIPHAIFTVIGGFICDFIINDYSSRIRIVLGYGLFALSDFLGIVIPILLFGPAIFIKNAEQKWHMTAEQIKQWVSYFTVHWIVIFSILTFILASLGAYIATKILKKHFEKAGVIKNREKKKKK